MDAGVMIRVDRSELEDQPVVICKRCGSIGGLVLRDDWFVCRREALCELNLMQRRVRLRVPASP